MSTSFPNLGKYQIVQEIGRGGMGAVYKGYDPFLDRTVAIKILAPHLVWEKAFLERFLREARAAARLQHPNVIAVHDVGQDGDKYYFVMTYLPGPSLKEFISQKGRLAPAEALLILRQLADALDYAHSKGLVHRDVKPANAMFDERGQVVLMDFGIVKAAEESRLTSTGASIGTPQYMSPEQIQGAEVNARSDQYALGIIAFEMLTGRVPFDAATTTAILYKQVNEPPPSARLYCHDLPPGVGIALDRALSKSPAGRFSSCGEFVGALEQALGLIAAPGRPASLPVAPAQPAPPPAPPPADRTLVYGEQRAEPRREWQPAPRPVAPPTAVRPVSPPAIQPPPPRPAPARGGSNFLPLMLAGAVGMVALILVGLIAVAILTSKRSAPGAPGIAPMPTAAPTDTPMPTATLAPTSVFEPTQTPTLPSAQHPVDTQPPTATASPVPSNTPVPTFTRTRVPPTRTRVPPTPTPVPPTSPPTSSTGATISFWANKYTINKGECVKISWSIEHVKAVFYKAGNSESRAASGHETVKECPAVTTRYELAIQHLNGDWEPRALTITVQ